MTDTVAEVEIFMAYQFRRSKIPRVDREHYLAQAVERVNEALQDEGLPFRATYSWLDLESGIALGPQVLSAVDRSTIFIADISELNQNVILELGFALGVGQRDPTTRIHVLAHESLSTRDLPANILGIHVERYNDRSFQQLVPRLIRESIRKMTPGLQLLSERKTWTKFWGFEHAAAVDIICSEIPPLERPSYANNRHPNFLRYAKFADLDSLVALHQQITARFPSAELRDYGASESHLQHSNAVLVGGAAWNTRVRRLQEYIPIAFVDATNDETDSLLVETPEARIVFETQFNGSGVATSDYFIFARLRPDAASRVLFFGGGLTHGVLGGIRTFSATSPGPSNAEYIASISSESDEVIVVGRVYHNDGYLRTMDFARTAPCLVLRRSETEAQFSSIVSGCQCNLHHEPQNH